MSITGNLKEIAAWIDAAEEAARRNTETPPFQPLIFALFGALQDINDELEDTRRQLNERIDEPPRGE